jgi:hypothetical protein
LLLFRFKLQKANIDPETGLSKDPKFVSIDSYSVSLYLKNIILFGGNIIIASLEYVGEDQSTKQYYTF